jgi:hypothetical protein
MTINKKELIMKFTDEDAKDTNAKLLIELETILTGLRSGLMMDIHTWEQEIIEDDISVFMDDDGNPIPATRKEKKVARKMLFDQISQGEAYLRAVFEIDRVIDKMGKAQKHETHV